MFILSQLFLLVLSLSLCCAKTYWFARESITPMNLMEFLTSTSAARHRDAFVAMLFLSWGNEQVTKSNIYADGPRRVRRDAVKLQPGSLTLQSWWGTWWNMHETDVVEVTPKWLWEKNFTEFTLYLPFFFLFWRGWWEADFVMCQGSRKKEMILKMKTSSGEKTLLYPTFIVSLIRQVYLSKTALQTDFTGHS